jgi:hypothetical protein
MNIIKKIPTIIKMINEHKGTVIVTGSSIRTNKLIYDFGLEKKIDYIFDNDINKLNTKYLSIPIVNKEIFKTIDNPLVVIWGNNTLSFYNQMKNIKNIKIIVEYQEYLSLNQNLSIILNSDFTFEIETPNYRINDAQNNSNKFIPILIKNLIQLNKNIKTKVVYSNNENYFTQRKAKKETFLFSYHSVGKKSNNIIRYKDGYLHNMITFDKKGYSGWSSLCEKDIDKLLLNISNKKSNELFTKLSKKHIDNNKSKYTQPKDIDFVFPKDFIFFPLQTLNDSVMKLSYFEPIELIKDIVSVLNKKNIPLVIKQHPRCKNPKLKELLLEYEKNKKIILFSGSIHDAISKAKSIYTINSGVGFEALLHLKPVVTFGKSDYISMTKNIKDLKDIKKEPFYHLSETDKKIIKKFLYYYITEKCLFLDDTKKLEKFINIFIINYLKKCREF